MDSESQGNLYPYRWDDGREDLDAVGQSDYFAIVRGGQGSKRYVIRPD